MISGVTAAGGIVLAAFVGSCRFIIAVTGVLIGFAAFTKNQTGVPWTFNRTVRTFVCRTGITQIRTAWRVHAFFRRRPGVKGEQSSCH